MRWSKLAWLAVLLFVVSGCGLRTWVEVDISEDSSGVVTLQLQSDQELRDGLAAFSPDTDAVAQLSAGLAEQGWEIADTAPDGEWEGVVATKSFADLQELGGVLDQAVQGGGSSIEVLETADGYSLSAELGPPAGDGNQQQLLAQAADVVDLDGRLTVRFPGEVTATNGEIQSDGASVVWRYDEESIVDFRLEAEANKPTGPGLWLFLVIGAVALAGAGLAVAVVRVRSASVPPSALGERDDGDDVAGSALG